MAGAPSNGSNSKNGVTTTASVSETTPLTTAGTARSSFLSGDAEASRLYHESKLLGQGHAASEDGHQTEGGFLKPIIFGGLDGILTSFAIVAGAAGGRLDPSVVLILGFSNIFADALSMGVGEFLSSKAENEWIMSERDREEWELENYPEGEIAEMVDIYKEKGMSHDDAVLVIETMAKYKDFFVDVMMTQELELQVPEENHVQESFNEGIVMFCSFAFFGAMPLLVRADVRTCGGRKKLGRLVSIVLASCALEVALCDKHKYSPSQLLHSPHPSRDT